jgi:Ca-activated chloride channel family protein
VEQVFHNPNGRDLEAIYSFPLPEKGAVAEFTYWIDGQPVTGEVLPKEKARQVYEDQKAAGNETALAEQDGYKTFDMAVWPVRAGGEVRIRLAYIQPAHLDTGIGRFVYPLEEGGVDEQRLAFWTAEDAVTGRFSFDLALRSAHPVEALRLPAHPHAVARRRGRRPCPRAGPCSRRRSPAPSVSTPTSRFTGAWPRACRPAST